MNDYYLTPADYATAETNGISYARAFQRHYVQGWPKERAITTPPRRTYPKEVFELADKNGIQRKTLYQRVRRGMTPEQAATMPVMAFTSAGKNGALKRWGKEKKGPQVSQHQRTRGKCFNDIITRKGDFVDKENGRRALGTVPEVTVPILPHVRDNARQ